MEDIYGDENDGWGPVDEDGDSIMTPEPSQA